MLIVTSWDKISLRGHIQCFKMLKTTIFYENKKCTYFDIFRSNANFCHLFGTCDWFCPMTSQFVNYFHIDINNFSSGTDNFKFKFKNLNNVCIHNCITFDCLCISTGRREKEVKRLR